MEPSGKTMRMRAANWRNLGTVLVVIAGIGSFAFAINAAQAASIFEESDFNGGVFFLTLLVSLGSAMVVIWPYFMFAQTMEALGVLLDRSTEVAKPTWPKQPPAKVAPPQRKSEIRKEAESISATERPVSQRALDVLEYLGEHGASSVPEIRDGTGSFFGITETMAELKAAGLVSQHGGLYSRRNDQVAAVTPVLDTANPQPPLTDSPVPVANPDETVSASQRAAETHAAMRRCPACDATVKEGHRFCSTCGTAVSP